MKKMAVIRAEGGYKSSKKHGAANLSSCPLRSKHEGLNGI